MQAIYREGRQEMAKGLSLVQQNFILYQNHTKKYPSLCFPDPDFVSYSQVLLVI